MPPISMERYPGKEYVLRILCVECAIFVRVLRGIEETLQIALWLELKQVIDNRLVYSLRGEAINALTLIHDTVLGNDYPEKG